MHLIILLLAAVTACNRAESTGKGPGGPGGTGGGPPAMPVETAAAQSDTVVDAILATGQIEALQSIELRPDVEGRLTQILVREGSLVSRGTPLFKIDDAELKAQVDQITAERDLARQSLNRTRELLSQKASSQSELERAEATRRSSTCSRCAWTGRSSARRLPA
jgi:membrane fusion protein (multidrug efflux system)